MGINTYVLRRAGGSDPVMTFTAANIRDATVHVMYSEEFRDYNNHIHVLYDVHTNADADICMDLPFGIQVIYKLEEKNDEII